MIGTDSGRGDEAATRSVEQSGITSSTRARNQRISVVHCRRSYLLGSKIFNRGHTVEKAVDKGDIFLNYYFHIESAHA